jgi:FkbM family methyltransferase
MMKDILGNFLRVTPSFKGKWRLQEIWRRTLADGDHRIARLPDGSILKVQLDVPYEQMVWLQDEEWDELQYLQNKLRAGDVFIDVGANIGLWTLVAATSVGPSGRVFSFEPNPITFDRLSENITLNGKVSRVEASAKAVSADESVVSFVCDRQHNLSAISSSGSDGPYTKKVPTVALDCLLVNELVASRLAGIKLDTEGHELAALQGASGLIEERWPWLIIEFNTTLLASDALGDWPVYRFLAAKSYAPFVYDKRGKETEIGSSFALHGYRNILFVRNQ